MSQYAEITTVETIQCVVFPFPSPFPFLFLLFFFSSCKIQNKNVVIFLFCYVSHRKQISSLSPGKSGLLAQWVIGSHLTFFSGQSNAN